MLFRKKLIIELDGSQHLEQSEYGMAFFESKGYRILRFWNHDVMNDIETVLKVIWSALNEEEKDGQDSGRSSIP